MALRTPAGCEFVPADDADDDMLLAVRELAWRCGESYASYILTERGWDTFWLPDRRGAVRFVRCGWYYAYSTGGLLATKEDQAELVERFTEFLKLNRLTAIFVCLGRDQLPPFKASRYEISKGGEEPIVRLDSTAWHGKEFEWVRRQENFCLRKGVELAELTPDPNDAYYRETIVPELEVISREHLAGTPNGGELAWFVGRFRPLEMGHQRLFVARSNSRIEAFVVCTPALEGSLWAIEMFRRRDDAVRGVIPFAMLQIMRRMQSEGVQYCSLSAVPAVRAGRPIRGDSFWVRGTMYLHWNYLNWLYDARGMYHFKSRFRPESREVYFVASPRATLWSMILFAWLFGHFRITPWRALSLWLKSWRRPPTRQTLAEPEFRPERCLRELRVKEKAKSK